MAKSVRMGCSLKTFWQGDFCVLDECLVVDIKMCPGSSVSVDFSLQSWTYWYFCGLIAFAYDIDVAVVNVAWLDIRCFAASKSCERHERPYQASVWCRGVCDDCVNFFCGPEVTDCLDSFPFGDCL